MKPKRLKPEARKREIFDAMAELAEVYGYANVTRAMIADALGLVPSAIQYHFDDVRDMREQFMQHAIDRRLLKVIAEGVVCGSPAALRAPRALKVEALQSLA